MNHPAHPVKHNGVIPPMTAVVPTLKPVPAGKTSDDTATTPPHPPEGTVLS
jgi:hypothetical protein